ncbi:hypothetical protein CVU37_09380 [candidate division BRC1 bacterium HGW-BRC1-1]|nr:MAG: hypothetical protein CVU37_09380 [candidate division BRC1 bacterium HGW-BRC1-1]
MQNRIIGFAAALTLFAGSVSLNAMSVNEIKAERDGVQVIMGGLAGLYISVDGIPFTNQSTLYAVKKDWNGRWFGYDNDPRAMSRATHAKSADGGDVFTVGLKSVDNTFEATHTLELLPGRVVRLSTDALLTTNSFGMLEHQMGGINPAWIAGRQLTITGGEAKTPTMLAPSVAKEGETRLAPLFEKVTIDTRMGPVELISKGDVKASLLDYRKNKYSALTPHYWLGVLGKMLTPNKVLSYSVEFRFPPKREMRSTTAEVSAAPADAQTMLMPVKVEDRIFPTPKKATWSETNFAINAETTIRVDADTAAAAQLKPAVAGLTNFVKRECALTLRQTDAKSANQIVLTCKPGSVDVAPDNDEQYQVRVGKTAECTANTTAGLMNSIKTLQQLVRAEGDKVSLRGCSVDDYPAMPYRGIHFFSGKDARELQLKMVRDILGALKINQIVYQCEYIMWDATRLVHHPKFAMTKDDARAVVEECERQGIEITPLINTFGHSEWLLDNKVYGHLSDSPKTPFAYDPSNPEVYALTDKIHEEVLAFFKPRMLHIGHDEITISGFPFKEANKKVGSTNLIMNDIMHHYNFLKARGVRTMLWGDMFLGPGEATDATHADTKEAARERRERLPKDVFITDWHYDTVPVEKFTSLKLLNDAGFDTVASPWYEPVNVVNFTRAAKLQYDATAKSTGGKTLGVLDTTWAGYSFGQESFEANQEQYAAYFLAAEAAWTGAPKPFDEMDLDYRAEFSRMWTGSDLPRGKRAGWTVDLSAVANFDATAKGKADWLGHAGAAGMVNLPVGEARLGRFVFNIPGKKGAPKAVLMSGQMNPDGKWLDRLSVPVDKTAAAIGFAVAATLPGPASPAIADSTFTYDDGTTEGITWNLGQTAFAVDDPRASATSPVAWKNTPEGAMAEVVHQFVWRNPQPAKKVKSITFQSNNQASGLLLFGISGVSPE